MNFPVYSFCPPPFVTFLVVIIAVVTVHRWVQTCSVPTPSLRGYPFCHLRTSLCHLLGDCRASNYFVTPRIHRRITGLLSANSTVLTPFCANPNRQNPFPFVLISADRTHFLSCKRQQTELCLFCANINNRTHYLFPFVLTATGIICNA